MKRIPIGVWCALSFAAAIAIALALPGKYRYLAHPKAAEDLAEQLRFGKWERIVDYIPEEELKEAAMTRAQTERLFRDYIKPAFEKESQDRTIKVATTEYNSTVTIGKGQTKFEVLLSNYPALLRPSLVWGIRTSLTQVAVMRSIQATPELQGKARRAETARQLFIVERECKAFGLKALPPRPASMNGRSLKLFP